MKQKKVLVVAVHPDDETLGCGGTLLKHKAIGDDIYWLIITNIDKINGWKKEIVDKRQIEIEKVSVLYGFKKTFKLDFPITKLDQVPMCNLINEISRVFIEVKPEIVYLPNRSDVHTDHQVAFKAAYSCTKNFRYPFIKKVLMYECLSETEFSPALPNETFVPNVFVDITNFTERKLKIMNMYKSEVMSAPYPRSISSIEALARIRGSRAGVMYAEAFMLLFEKR